MSGEELKAKIKAKGFTLREVAERLGESPQNLQGWLKSHDVKSGQIERIAKAMGESVSYFYNELPLYSVEDYVRVKILESENALMRQLLGEKVEKK